MLKKITFLIIDAENNSCEEMHEFLQREGFTVLTSPTAAEGWQLLMHSNIDILILDIGLPDADGLQFFRECKSNFPKLEGIIISGQGDLDSVIQAMHLGALDFLRKPLRQKDLLAAIERSMKLRKTYRITPCPDVTESLGNPSASSYHRRRVLLPKSENHFNRSIYPV
jgi:DNA-binding NtrC family response regulator